MSRKINRKMLNHVLCTCSKCRQNDTEQGIGILISKSTRTKHRKLDREQEEFSSLSSSSDSDPSSILIDTFVADILERYTI